MATPISSLSNDIASLCLHHPNHFHIQLHQTEHRLALISNWPISEGDSILEIGCGQGDCTAVLAELVGPQGHITAVDPAPLTYGSLYTLGESQAHLSSGRLGERITWTQADPLKFLESQPESAKYDVAVLAHCIWYFSSPELITATLRLLSTRVRCICVAEWSLSSSASNANTHVLAVLTQAALECRRPGVQSNVRTVVSPTSIKGMTAKVGLVVQREDFITPSEGVLDGRWEVMAVMDMEFSDGINELVEDGREKSVVLAMKDAVEASMKQVGGITEVRSMDVWCAVLTLPKEASESEAQLAFPVLIPND